jgi:hypothetical protein
MNMIDNLSNLKIMGKGELLSSITAQAIVLYVQTIIIENKIDGEHFASLQHSAHMFLYNIRELNDCNDDRYDGSDQKIGISRAKHQELYFYDYEFNKIMEKYIETKDGKWKNEYKKNYERLYKL